MFLFSYVVARDYGFAPNPFNGVCTLATCKPAIRKSAVIGDWIIGTGPTKRFNIPNRLIFAMKVTEKVTFNQYWHDLRFQMKKPHMNGGLKQAFGDNIYFQHDNGEWHQENSHHSYEGGKINFNNLRKDTSSPNVLISSHFYYFGKEHTALPEKFHQMCVGRGHKKNHEESLVRSFLEWLQASFVPGFKANPIQFTSFERYDGVS